MIKSDQAQADAITSDMTYDLDVGWQAESLKRSLMKFAK